MWVLSGVIRSCLGAGFVAPVCCHAMSLGVSFVALVCCHSMLFGGWFCCSCLLSFDVFRGAGFVALVRCHSMLYGCGFVARLLSFNVFAGAVVVAHVCRRSMLSGTDSVAPVCGHSMFFGKRLCCSRLLSFDVLWGLFFVSCFCVVVIGAPVLHPPLLLCPSLLPRSTSPPSPSSFLLLLPPLPPFFSSLLPASPGEEPGAKADSTLRASRAVPHPSTDRALRRLTSEVRRDPVHSTRYGRQRKVFPAWVA